MKDDITFDRAAMGRLAEPLSFICGADHPTTVALMTCSDDLSNDVGGPLGEDWLRAEPLSAALPVRSTRVSAAGMAV